MYFMKVYIVQSGTFIGCYLVRVLLEVVVFNTVLLLESATRQNVADA